MKEGNGIQAYIDPMISDKQFLKMSAETFLPSVSATKSLSMLTRLQTWAQIMQTNYSGQRGEFCRKSTLGMQFTRNLLQDNSIDDKDNSIDDLFVYGAGKTNQYGHKEYGGSVPHMQPILDYNAHLGLCFLWRFTFLKETFPDHLDGKAILNRPLFRSHNNSQCPICPDRQNQHFHALYDSAGVSIPKVTHHVS